MATFVIRQNDRLPVIAAQLKDATGTAVDLTGATVKFQMKNQTTGVVKVNTAATITTATTGRVSYSWAAIDTDTAGTYTAAFEVTFASGNKETFPNLDTLSVTVTTDVA